MGAATGFHHLHVRSDHSEASVLRAELKSVLEPRLMEHGAQVWGSFQGLFGLHSRDLILLIAHPVRGADFVEQLPGWLPQGVSIVERYSWVPAARPENSTPLSRDGLYVLRFFDVRHADAEEIATLSRQAWVTFESSARYASEPLALFKEQLGEPVSAEARGRMLLVTWYDGFASWQASRQPAPAATANFQRRAALTGGTMAYACRLLP